MRGFCYLVDVLAAKVTPSRLFHFSDTPHIGTFMPRPVRVPSARPAGQEWLNGPLVWAIDADHQPMYLFPRECPRILLWPTPSTTPEDYARWWGDRSCRAIAHIEWAWLDRLRTESLHRYELPTTSFQDIDDAGMWVSRTPVIPLAIDTVSDLPAELRAQGVELRVMESLAPLKDVWATSLHVSAIRLRNARPSN
jgi:hypothetical protein